MHYRTRATLVVLQIAALRRRLLRQRTVAQIDEPLDCRHQTDAQSEAGRFGETAIAAGAGIAEFVRFPPSRLRRVGVASREV